MLTLLEQALEITLVALLVPFLAAFFGRLKSDLAGLWAMSLGTVVWAVHSVGGAWALPVESDPATANWWESMWHFPSSLPGLSASAGGFAPG